MQGGEQSLVALGSEVGSSPEKFPVRNVVPPPLDYPDPLGPLGSLRC